MKFAKQLAELSAISFDKGVKRFANLAASKLIDAAAKGVFQTEIHIDTVNGKEDNETLDFFKSKKFLKSLEKELEGVKVSLKEKNVPVLIGKPRISYSLHFDWEGARNGKQ